VTKFTTLLEAAKTHQSKEDMDFPRRLESRRGRPPGKRSHPDFEQITAYIRRDTHRAVKIALLKNGRKEFSELVEDLLGQWLKSDA
jgi:FMN phosphatase YigB (HAD superfamily)